METESKPRIVMHGGDSMTIDGILHEDQQKVLASFNAGAYWIRVKDGNLEIVPSWENLPDPIKDKKMLPFWRKATVAETAQLKLFELEGVHENDSPSISIQSLCGYSYSPENYQFLAEKLESYGFQCMRSRRGAGARYWEIWFLPGLWAAEGDLKEKIGRHKGKNAMKAATSFLAQNIEFGTLDVSVQRMCAVLD
ncbi:MAG: hypothetical protein WC657_00760 [Candidatus Paceibacterota bacterium]|jgi:hypothetical protein